MKTVIATICITLAGVAFADDMALVIARRPNMVTVQQQQCTNQEVIVQSDGTRGEIIGGVAGAALGSTIGHNSRDRLAGAVIGGLVGGAIGNELSKSPAQVQQRVVCSYVPVTVQRGEFVTFQYQGRQFTQLIQ